MEDRKKIHKTENHIQEIQSSINIIKFAILVIIMDIAQNLDSRNNIFLELMYMSRNALFAGKNVCMPHPPSVGAGIPWVEQPISNCDTCTLFEVHTSGTTRVLVTTSQLLQLLRVAFLDYHPAT